MRLFQRKAEPHRCPEPPEPTAARVMLSMQKGTRIVLKAHQMGGAFPMGWITVEVNDSNDMTVFELTMHFDSMDDYHETRQRLRVPQWVEGVEVKELNDGDHTGT